MGFVDADVIAGADLFTSAYAAIYHFGILTSTMHMAWVGTVAGRLKSDYRYSAGLVFNTYPWPESAPGLCAAVEEAAQAVLDARAPRLAAGSSLADLYDPLAMPAELLKAHQALDRAVDRSYRKEPFPSDRERVEFLFHLYEKLTSPLALQTPAKPKRSRRLKP
jgi:hypothetical protein